MNRENIKFRYALDTNGRVVDILSGYVIKGRDYVCLACSNNLRPVKGAIREHHFRHRFDVNCSAETYLHRLAKLVFYETYQECILLKRPYYIKYQVPVQCNACNEKDPCFFGQEVVCINLVERFSIIKLEKKHGEFIPDIVLKTEYGTDAVYVEVAVTHSVGEHKKISGNKIIELRIKNEQDIEKIKDLCLAEESSMVEFFNFSKNSISHDFSNHCRKKKYTEKELFGSFDKGLLFREGKEALCTQCKGYFKKESSDYAYFDPVKGECICRACSKKMV